MYPLEYVTVQYPTLEKNQSINAHIQYSPYQLSLLHLNQTGPVALPNAMPLATPAAQAAL